jgi:hypothetical protein
MATIYPPGKLERAARAGAYAFTALIGLSVILDPPDNSVKTALGLTLTVIWSVFILSAVFCIPGAILGRYRVEYALLPLFTAALLVAVLAIWFHAGDDSFLVPRASASSALICLFIARWGALHKILQTLEHMAERAGPTWTRPQSK